MEPSSPILIGKAHFIHHAIRKQDMQQTSIQVWQVRILAQGQVNGIYGRPNRRDR